MDWDNVTIDGDTLDPLFWKRLFQERPEALFDLIYDCYATKHGKLGRGRRRKMDGNLEDIWRLFYGTDGDH